MFGTLTDQLASSFKELMGELRAIREELALLRTTMEDRQRHPALRPVGKKASGGPR